MSRSSSRGSDSRPGAMSPCPVGSGKVEGETASKNSMSDEDDQEGKMFLPLEISLIIDVG